MRKLLLVVVGLLLAVPVFGQSERGFVDHVETHDAYPCNAARAGHRIWCEAHGLEETCNGTAWVGTISGLTSVFDCTGPTCNDIHAKSASVLDFTQDTLGNPLDADTENIELRLPTSSDCWNQLDTFFGGPAPKESAICAPELTPGYAYYNESVFIGRDLTAINAAATPVNPWAEDGVAQDIGGDIRGIWDCVDEDTQWMGNGLGEMPDAEQYSSIRCNRPIVPDFGNLDMSGLGHLMGCDFNRASDGSNILSVSGGGTPAEINVSGTHDIETGTPRTVLITGTGGVYDGYWTGTRVDNNTFSIPTADVGTATGYAYWKAAQDGSRVDGDCFDPIVDDMYTGLMLPGMYFPDAQVPDNPPGTAPSGLHCSNWSNPVTQKVDEGSLLFGHGESPGQVCYYWHDEDRDEDAYDRQLWVASDKDDDFDSVSDIGGIAEFVTDFTYDSDHRFVPGDRVDIYSATDDYDAANLTVTKVSGANNNLVQTMTATGPVLFTQTDSGTITLNPDRIGGVCQQILWSDHAGNPAGSIFLDLRDHDGSGTINNEDEFLMAAAVMTASHLACTATAAPGAGNSWDITVLSGIEDSGLDTQPTNVTCSIEGATDVHCVNNDNIAVIPASTIVNPWAISIEVEGISSPNAATIDCRMCLTAK